MEGRLYKESMTGVTAKSTPISTKNDEKELGRLQKQDYWLQVSRAKLVMDLIFVCESQFPTSVGIPEKTSNLYHGYNSLRTLPYQTSKGYRQSVHWYLVGYSKVRHNDREQKQKSDLLGFSAVLQKRITDINLLFSSLHYLDETLDVLPPVVPQFCGAALYHLFI